MKGIDDELLVEKFALEKGKNLYFYFDFDRDNYGRLVGCFWTDSYSRTDNFFGM